MSKMKFGLAGSVALAAFGGLHGTAVGLQDGPTFGTAFVESYSITAIEDPVLDAVPGSFGGVAFPLDDPSTLLLGGNANQAGGAIYALTVVRDGDGHITGFTGEPVTFANAPYIENIVYHPSGVLFQTGYNVNTLAQFLPGSTEPDTVEPMAEYGVPTSISPIAFLPPGYPGAGGLRIGSWSGGAYFSVVLGPQDENGLFSIDSVTQIPLSDGPNIPGGPAGFVYVGPENEGFDTQTLLVNAFSANAVRAYDLDASGDPILATQRTFLDNISSPLGAAIDPVTGDFVFSTFGSNEVFIISGFEVPTTWEPAGSGLNATAHAVMTFDDGLGDEPTVYVGGVFTNAGEVDASRIARWNGVAWSGVGGGLDGTFVIVNDMITWDDGNGEALYVAGRFTTAGGETVNNIARWDGNQWSALGSGLSGTAYALAVFDGDLYVGGAFTHAGGIAVNHIARWDGSAWSALDGGVSGSLTRVYAMEVLDPCDPENETNPPCLLIGGRFTHAGGTTASYHAQWDGQQWLNVDRVFNGSVRAITFTTSGPTGWDVFIGGSFTAVDELMAGGIVHVDAQNNLNVMGSGIAKAGSAEAAVLDIESYFGESGFEVLIAGQFDAAGGAEANNIAVWRNGAWEQYGGGGGANGPVTTLHTISGFPCSRVVAAGAFEMIGNLTANRIAMHEECPPPASIVSNTTCETASVIGDGLHSFDSTFATTDGMPEPSLCAIDGDAQIHADLWYEFTASCHGSMTVELCGSSFNTKLGVYVPHCDAESGSIIACDAVSCDGQHARVVIPVNAGEVFLLRVGGQSGESGIGALNVQCEPGVLGDLNGDGVVDVSDLLILISEWGACLGSDYCPADLNGDGVVDVFDLLILIGSWG